MQVPVEVKEIIDELHKRGYEAYCVGGCVRDAILGREAEDWDITTSALPEEIKEIFPRTVDTGIAHGTVTVLWRGDGYEVTTYRIDGEYENGRHPNSVSFTRNLTEDLKRRDFTINAMAYNETEGLVDIFGGRADIKAKRIRCVGEARERFDEDALRILRAVRFSAQLKFEIEAKTASAIEALSENLQKISAERIQVEMVKLLISGNPDYIDVAYKLGITKHILPEWDAEMASGRGAKRLDLLKEVPEDKILRLAMLFYDLEAEQVRKILRRWKFDNHTTKSVCKLIEYKGYEIGETREAVRRAMSFMGVTLLEMHLKMFSAVAKVPEESRKVEWIQMEAHSVLERGECIAIKELAVTGRDLLEIGVKSGPYLGEVLESLLESVLQDPDKNRKEFLLAVVADNLKEK